MMVLLLVFVVYPIVASLGYTFYRWNGIGDPTDFVGLDNFRQIIARRHLLGRARAHLRLRRSSSSRCNWCWRWRSRWC